MSSNLPKVTQGNCVASFASHIGSQTLTSAYIFLGHSKCKAAGRCTENGQKILTCVMIMSEDLGDQVGHARTV